MRIFDGIDIHCDRLGEVVFKGRSLRMTYGNLPEAA